MKKRTEKNGTKNNDWETPQYIYDYIEKEFFEGYSEYFDPCPLNAKFDGLKRSWGMANYINPPYTRKLKEAFIRKAFEESKKGKVCVMLLPVSTSTKIFHEIIYPNAEIRFTPFCLCSIFCKIQWTRVKIKIKLLVKFIIHLLWCCPVIVLN